MKAIVLDRYGPPQRLSLREVDRPVVTSGEVLLEVQAAAINDWDWAVGSAPTAHRWLAASASS